MDENCFVEPIPKTTTAEDRRNIGMALQTVWGDGMPSALIEGFYLLVPDYQLIVPIFS